MPPSKKNKVIMWSLFVPPCMFFEAGQPVAKRLRPCAKVCVCVLFTLQSSLFVIVVQEKRLREYWLRLQAGNRNRSSTVTCFTGTHGGGTPGNPHKPQSSCHVNKCDIETVSRWHAPARPLPVWFFLDCFSFWQTLECFLVPLHSYFVPVPAKQEKEHFGQLFLDTLNVRQCLCTREDIPVQASLVSSWAPAQGLTFSCVPPAPLSEPLAPGLSSSSPSLSGVLVYSAVRGPCDKQKQEDDENK